MNLEITYLILEYVGIVLLLFLFGHCVYRSINYTLQIICLVGILNNLNESVLLVHYRSHVLTEAKGTTVCTVSAVLEHFVPLSLTLLSGCMGFNVWFLIVRTSKLVERQLIPWYCLVSFGIPLITTVIAIILLRDEPYWTAYPRRFYCSMGENDVTLGTFTIFMLLGALFGILFTLHTVVYLTRHYLQTRRSMNSSGSSFQRSIVLELSHCIRLIIFSLAFGIIVLMAVLQKLVETHWQRHSAEKSETLDVSSDFSGCLVPFALFIIFGTTRDSIRTMSLLVCPWRNRRNKSTVDAQQDLENPPRMTPKSSSSGNQFSFEDMLRQG
ncbi:MAG: hypothetical protein J3Q66DRAFT_15596 [Benniella sp.]|nr:MAG: hypothetical protein J3Q66DRAFT_15596 [Benniella sp.]